MNVELLQLLSLISYILAGVFFLVSVALFFLLGVPKLVGNLTGITERRAIESIRQQNKDIDKDNYLKNNRTDKITAPNNNAKKRSLYEFNMNTEKISTARLNFTSEETTVLNTSQDETTVLSDNQNETTVLYNGETAVLSDETTILAENPNETTVLYNGQTTVLGNENCPETVPQAETYSSEFVVECQLCFLGSDEIIE